ncbi:MAG: hypothetical protein VCA37_02630 [Roseibacillus sp.]
MKLNRPLLAVLAALTPAAFAGEFTVEKKPFKATVSLDGTFLPDKVHLLKIDPKAWTDFTILELVAQGGTVAKGQPVVTLDTEPIARRLSDDSDATRLRKMALATAERDLANLDQSTPWKLETAELAYKRAKDDHDYFVEISRPLQEESATRSLASAERYLEYATEELKQLLKMYKEDDLTEETEEIILKRQRYAVDAAEFRLKSAQFSTKRNLEVTIPRSAIDKEQALKDAEIAWKTQRESLPRALEQKNLEVKKARVDDQRSDEKSAELKGDRAQMDLASPANGRVYHGEIRNGRWSAVSAAKFMKVGGKVPARTVFATVIPEGAKVQLDAFVDEKTVSRLKAGQKGYVAPVSAPRSRLSVTVAEVASHPAVDGKYHVVLKVGGEPVGTQLVPGMKGKIKLTIGDEGDSLAIPVNALHEEADGSYTVKVKGEDGESSIAVEVGTESSGKIVVLSGLKAGQVIITPDAAKAEEPKKK